MTRLTTTRISPSSARPSRIAMALLVALGATASTAAWSDEPAFMSGAWAGAACAAWNQDPILTQDLVKSGWIKNDKGRGFKVMQVYRSDCGDKPTAEMRIALKDAKASCVYGGAPETAKLDSGA